MVDQIDVALTAVTLRDLDPTTTDCGMSPPVQECTPTNYNTRRSLKDGQSTDHESAVDTDIRRPSSVVSSDNTDRSNVKFGSHIDDTAFNSKPIIHSELNVKSMKAVGVVGVDILPWILPRVRRLFIAS